ncbi:MAG: amidohydrolase [Pirellulales bacterium]|jgi:predicted TIM-barrel fold metal-dependent hydrolase|nr:amidohydrolase [Pirellulales bacterium]
MADRTTTHAPPAAGHFIDAHVHVWTDDFERYPFAAGFTREGIKPRRFTPADLLELCIPLGVDRIVLIQMNFYGYDNSYMLDSIRRHPGVFAGIAQVDEHGTDPAAEMRRLKQAGVRGVRITPGSRKENGWLDGVGMRAMWKTAAQEQMAMCPLIDATRLPDVDRTCRAFPETCVVIDHCARIRGGGQFHADEIQNLCSLARHKNVYVKLSAFYFLSSLGPPYTDVAPLIRSLLAAFGPQRLMWATDSPFQFQPPHTYAASLELIRDRLDFVPTSDRQWLLQRTAESVFFG